MKRRLFKLVLFLLLGAIVNVAVAWGFAAWGGQGTSVQQTYIGNTVRWTHGETEYYVTVFGSVWHGASRIMLIWDDKESTDQFKWAKPREELLLSWGQAPRPDGPTDVFGGLPWTNLDARGWPMLCLWSRFDSIFASPAGRQLIRETHGVRIPPFKLPNANPFDHARHLPLAPIWPGFAINTFFYAVILWSLTLGPFTVRRMIRRKRGHCIKCSYDLRNVEHEKCPECGAGVS